MGNATLSATLPKFIQQVEQCHSRQHRPLTVNDLRLGIRSERLSEISAWRITFWMPCKCMRLNSRTTLHWSAS